MKNERKKSEIKIVETRKFETRTSTVLKEDNRARKAIEGTPNNNDELKKHHLPEKSVN